MKARTLALFCFLTVLTANSYAFGLGKIQVNSSLNEVFEATVELTGTVDFNEEELVAQLGSVADFERMGISRESVLLQLSFKPDLKAKPAVIVIRSDKAINEPFLDFILSVHSPKAQLMKEYTVFLNPTQ